MRRAHFFAAAISTLALVGAATASHAESVSMAGPGQPSHKLFQWDQKGRWSLRLESESLGLIGVVDMHRFDVRHRIDGDRLEP